MIGTKSIVKFKAIQSQSIPLFYLEEPSTENSLSSAFEQVVPTITVVRKHWATNLVCHKSLANDHSMGSRRLAC